MTNRWDNILGSFDWDKLRTDFESLHKNAEDAGFELKIVDDQCPCCGFRPCFVMKERRLKKLRRGDDGPNPLARNRQGKLFDD